MTTYVKITDYAAKDALLTGNPSKLVKGTELGAEFDLIAAADADSVKSADIGVSVQAYDAFLTSVSALGTAADKMIYTTALNTAAETAITSFARSILDDADEATFKATVNLEIGTDVMAFAAAASQVEMEAGTEAALRSMSPLRVAQAIAAQGTGGITAGTAVASTSGTAIDFTSLPAGVNRITIMLAGVSTSGSSALFAQIGDSGGVETTGYSSTVSSVTNAAYGSDAYTAGFALNNGTVAGENHSGAIVLSRINGNTWVATNNITRTGTAVVYAGAGSKDLSATLDRVRITTAGGSDTFDAGTINILYE